jgi:thiol-disulfide isomerase/thioredoxin
MIETEPASRRVLDEDPGFCSLLGALRAGRARRVGLELAAVRGERHALCALALLPESLFVVHFGAEWDQSDRAVQASLRGLAYLTGFHFQTCDAGLEPDYALALGVLDVPTLIAFHQGREVGRKVGGDEIEPWVLVQRAEVLSGETLGGSVSLEGSAPDQGAR